MIYEVLQKWEWRYPDETFYLIFHVSVIRFSMEDLMQLADKIHYLWYLPKNVYYELKALEQDSLFGKKVKKFLELWKKKGNYVLKNNLEDFYENQEMLFGLSKKKTEKFIFVFANQLKMLEFIEYTRDADNYYLFFHNKWSFHQLDPEAVVLKIKEAKQRSILLDCIARYQTVLTQRERKIRIKNLNEGLRLIGIESKKEYYIEKKLKYGNGGEAYIYRIESDDTILLKMYKREISVTKELKLHMISQMEPYLDFLVTPVEIVKTKNMSMGFVLKKVEGDTLKVAYLKNIFTFYEKLEIMKKLIVMLLKLNLMSMVYVDLSLENIMVNKAGEIKIIDVDSMQYRYYSSEVAGKLSYRHKDYDNKKQKNLYRHLYQNFAFAVLTFKFLICGDISPLFQNGVEDYNLIWGGKIKFPYTPGTMLPGIVEQSCEQNWNAIPLILQEAFCEVFNFKRNGSLGYWYRILSETEQELKK